MPENEILKPITRTVVDGVAIELTLDGARGLLHYLRESNRVSPSWITRWLEDRLEAIPEVNDGRS